MATLSVRTSGLTKRLQSLTTQIMRDFSDPSLKYDSIDVANFSIEEIVAKLNEEFSKLVMITSSDPTLHIVAIVPLFEKASGEEIEKLYRACAELQHNITVHVIGLSEGLSALFEKTGAPAEISGNQDAALKTLNTLSANVSFQFSYTLIDDFASNGTAIGFTLESLARYIALIELALTQDYYAILSPALLAAHKGMNLSMGVASLSFPKNSVVKQLLGLGFLASLDKVGINDTEVDSQKAAHEAEIFLAGISQRYPNLYNKSIQPLYKDRGMDEGKVVAEASDIIKNDLDKLRADILGLLRNEEFSLPEKEAILAMILGRDNKNLHGIQYDHEGLLLDDICEDSLQLYIDAYNKYCIDKKWLPVRGDFEALKIKRWNEAEGKYEDVPENHEALNPLPKIKRLKQQMLNTTSFLREKKEELDGLQDSVKRRDDAEEIRRQWNKPKGNLIDFEYKEQPLDDKYVPAPSLQVKDSVDLRKFFPEVRNQEELGSCTSFAAAAMYEAMMARGGDQNAEYMSPGFLFYYSNILKGRPQGGSNYHDQLEVMGQQGICYDSLYTYDADNPSRQPLKEAQEDAAHHRVLKAAQILLSEEGEKSDYIKENHRLLVSALSEGYPIGISLKIYDNFGKDGPFVLHPDDTPNAKEEGYHAMVIAGYSEDNGFYIVRNSWGPEFGDEGYCYIPFTYIDDPEYLNFACIITEITDSAEGNPTEIPAVLANFAATETEIRMAAVRNAISTVKLELQRMQKLYAEYYKYYQKLMLRLTMPHVQNDIRKEAELGQAKYFLDIEERKRKLEDGFVNSLKEYKKVLFKTIMSLLGVTAIMGLTWYLTDSVVFMILFCVAAGLFILVAIGYKWWVRIKRRKLQEELDEMAVDAKRQREILMEMQIKFHVAGMWISRFHKLSLEIGALYDRLVSFNDTLREWQKEYTSQVGKAEETEGVMFITLDPSDHLQNFFNEHKTQIVSGIDLLSVFKDYQANVNDLEASRENLHNVVSASILALMDDFNLVNFLLGDKFSYLTPVNLQQEIDKMIQLGQPSFRNKERNASSPVRMLMSEVAPSRSEVWGNAITPFFPLRPVMLPLTDPSLLILLTLHPCYS